MCGIVGVVSTKKVLSIGQEKFFNQALTVGTLRGVDSTGVFFGNGQEKAWWMKEAQTGSEFVEKTFDATSRANDNFNWIIGHNRAATVGTITGETAHPFNKGTILGVHNGTLTHGWRDRLSGNAPLGVDSEALMSTIHKDGVEKAVFDAEGAMAIVYRDSKDGKVYVYRNSARPLHYALDDDTMYIMSEKPMLEWLLARNKIDVHTVGSFQEQFLYCISDGTPERLKRMPSTVGTSYSTGYYTGGVQRGNVVSRTGGSSATSKTTTAIVKSGNVAKKEQGGTTGFPNSEYHLANETRYTSGSHSPEAGIHYTMSILNTTGDQNIRGVISGLSHKECTLLTQLVRHTELSFRVNNPTLSTTGEWVAPVADITIAKPDFTWWDKHEASLSEFFAANFNLFNIDIWDWFQDRSGEVTPITKEVMKCAVCDEKIIAGKPYHSAAQSDCTVCSPECITTARMTYGVIGTFHTITEKVAS